MKLLLRLILIGTLYIPLSIYYRGASQDGSVEISINHDQTFQTINGWNAVAQIGQIACKDFESYQEEVIQRGVNELGITRFQLEISSGIENPVDYFSQVLLNQLSLADYRAHRYEWVDDNGDPYLLNPDGFQFSSMDYTIDKVILPYKKLLEANAEKLYLVLTYVDFDKKLLDHGSNPDEYAEFQLAIFNHLNEKYGWTPDAIEVILEPDVAGWQPETVASTLVAAGTRLKAAGFTPDFLAPSTTSMKNAAGYLERMLQNPAVLEYLKEVTYHRYSDVSPANLLKIKSLADANSLRTAMTEHIGSGYEDLHEDLKLGGNSAWSQYALAFCLQEDNGAHHYWIDTQDPNNPIVHLGSRSTFLTQYFRYIRPGAIRIGTTSNDASFDPLAFINVNGSFVIVIKASRAGTMSIQGLPDGIYGISYTTKQEFAMQLSDLEVIEGSKIIASIPSEGVVSVNWKSPNPSPTQAEVVSPESTPITGVEIVTTQMPLSSVPGDTPQPISPTPTYQAGQVTPPRATFTPVIITPAPGCTGRFFNR